MNGQTCDVFLLNEKNLVVLVHDFRLVPADHKRIPCAQETAKKAWGTEPRPSSQASINEIMLCMPLMIVKKAI